MAQSITKARYWVGVLYPENMKDGWQETICEDLQIPFAYCVHDKDVDSASNERKTHVHLILVFPNTTTYQHALSVFNLLSSDGCTAINTCKAIINIRWMYDYLIHNTEDCRKKKKVLYDPSERILGNLFDIGAYEQVSLAEKNNVAKEMCQLIVDNGITNFADFFLIIAEYEDTIYFETLKTYSGLFERLCKGTWQKSQNT